MAETEEAPRRKARTVARSGAKPSTVRELAADTEERFIDHEYRLSQAESNIQSMQVDMQEVREAVKSLKDNTEKLVQLAEKFIPVVRNVLYFLALVGANALLGGDTGAMERILKLATSIGGA